ncbi:Uncharacterised protein [Mycobacteroides abscessus subsp. abscessus]|nr:Uncharacterised protein [Mycobacteroides abscessus subsp. abscessus]
MHVQVVQHGTHVPHRGRDGVPTRVVQLLTGAVAAHIDGGHPVLLRQLRDVAMFGPHRRVLQAAVHQHDVGHTGPGTPIGAVSDRGPIGVGPPDETRLRNADFAYFGLRHGS